MQRFDVRLFHSSVCAAFVLMSLAATVSAATLFDDHFTGNSGGMPAGWSRILATGDVVEAGTTVTLGGESEDGVMIGSRETVDPTTGTITIVTDFVVISGQGASGLISGLEFPAACFFCAIRLRDSRVEVNTFESDEGGHYYDVGFLNGYTGGPIRLTLEMGPTTFSVSTDSPAFSSGPVLYSTVSPTFTREDLGVAASALLFDYGDEEGVPGRTIVDRITIDGAASSSVTDAQAPGESETFGRIKALFRR